MTTHVALVARAFGATTIYIHQHDENIKKTIEEVNKRFGGDFIVSSVNNWRKLIESWNGVIVHLTMYGIPLPEVKDEILSTINNRDLLIIVGAEKVPSDVYKKATFNVAIMNQPHSEVSSLAIFLYDLFPESMRNSLFNKSQLKIIPTAHGKKVIKNQ
ncbi:MAG: tRNA (cytidine(56)-2'-O)-methyltransferase [Candidatus Thermoplasmatota archaeon]|nr:tRNA (cytidine(56)-2'-O)-methyltransferase [Candidatus Thermoplasmatota archaeon]